MPFFRNLRRRSKASFKSNESQSNESQSNGDMTSGKSSSTLDTNTSATPPSSIKPNGASSPNLPALNETSPKTNGGPNTVPPQRPGPYVTPGQRHSTFVCDSTGWRLLHDVYASETNHQPLSIIGWQLHVNKQWYPIASAFLSLRSQNHLYYRRCLGTCCLCYPTGGCDVY